MARYKVTIEVAGEHSRKLVMEWPNGLFHVQFPVQYENGVIAYDWPEALPNRVKRMVEASFNHKPGILRFCNENCRDGFFEDRKLGLVYIQSLYLEEAKNGYCCYCRTYVPTNRERNFTIHPEQEFVR